MVIVRLDSRPARATKNVSLGRYVLAHRYVNGSPIRQEYLETAISWLSGGHIEQYMSAHQHDPNANELWSYFQAVIRWVELTFTTYRKEMKGVDWGSLYNQFKDELYDTDKLEDEIRALMVNDDVTSKKGIYQYELSAVNRSSCTSLRLQSLVLVSVLATVVALGRDDVGIRDTRNRRSRVGSREDLKV